MSDHKTLDREEVLARRVAGETLADIRTVRRFLRGEPVRGLVAQRIADAVQRIRAEVSS